MGRPSNNSRGSGGAAPGGDEERLPLRAGLETERASVPPPPPHHGAGEQHNKEARRGGTGGGRLWRASVRAGLVICLLSVPAVLLLLRWQADSSPQWVFDFEAPEEDDDDLGTYTRTLLFAPYYVIGLLLLLHKNCGQPNRSSTAISP